MRSPLLAVSPLLLLLSPLCLAQKPVTLDALTRDDGPTFASDIQWRPDSAGFAFRRGERMHYFDVASASTKDMPDCRQICMDAVKVPEPPAFEWENRGVRERRSQWCSDNRHMLLNSGGDLFWMDTQGDSIQQLTRTLYAEADPQLSDDCKQISFRKDYDLYVLNRETGRIKALTQGGNASRYYARLDWVYPEELALPTAHWWSPDSRHIALLEFDVSATPQYPHADYLASPPRPEPERYPKPGEPNASVRLGIVDSTTAKLRFVDFGDAANHLLARVQWLPDGKTVAVQRLNRIQNKLQLIFVNAETLEFEVILTEEDQHWVNLSHDFRYLPERDAFLWTSESTGHRHLYLYFTKERYARQLTQGSWEVSSVLGVNARASEVYVLATEKSPLERHVYAVKLDGGSPTASSAPIPAPRRVTTTDGSWTADFAPDGAHWVSRHSSLTMPANQQVLSAQGRVLSTLTERDEAEPREYRILPTEIHTVKTADGVVMYGKLIKPADFRPGRKYPMIVQVYGGPHAQSVRNSWAGASMDQVYAHAGFLVWQLDNRGTSGRGHVFEIPVSRKLGIVELQDQLLGIDYLKKLGFVDEARIGVNGWSYGGFMTLNCLLNAPQVFRAGISGAPVTDWRFYDTIYTERYMDLPSANEEGYRITSLLPKAGNLKGALLLIHNLWDDNVHFQNALHMADALQKAEKPFELMVYPQKAHGVRGKPATHMRAMMLRFFQRELQADFSKAKN
ncbi:MAG: DPP IV N-terminal domain-containing protein [Bryobacterales bacterium]|jgi:dipeptidyl-peptidase-4|nr:DPP IV N-terminal domain-containing protein [Bryobacterales bacterium]